MTHISLLRAGLLGLAALVGPALAQSASASAVPPPPTNHVLLISVDGLHAVDLTNYIKAHPASTLATLSNNGVVYPNASTTRPSDSFPGLLALVTGGTPKTNGVYYDNAYDRTYLPPVSFGLPSTPGTNALYDESIEYDFDYLDGGHKHVLGTPGNYSNDAIDPSHLPRLNDGKDTPVYPHDYLRSNTIFSVVHEAGGYTAWSDKHEAYDIVNGHGTPNSVDDLFNPEINATFDADGNNLYGPGENGTTNVANCEKYDAIKVQAIVNEIDGLNSHDRTKTAKVPNIFGMNFQSVSVGQKTAGYTDAAGTPTPDLQSALDFVDASLGRMRDELKLKGLLDSTTVIVTAKHGQAPIDITKLIKKKHTTITTKDPSDQLDPAVAPQVTTDDIALIWVANPTVTAQVANTQIALGTLKANLSADHIQAIISGPFIKFLYNDPTKDSRAPDIIAIPTPGVIYTGGSKVAEHGGFSKDDTNVALLVSNSSLFSGRTIVTDRVETRQVAPSILKLLNLDPQSLQAVQNENTSTLPGLGL